MQVHKIDLSSMRFAVEPDARSGPGQGEVEVIEAACLCGYRYRGVGRDLCEATDALRQRVREHNLTAETGAGTRALPET